MLNFRILSHPVNWLNVGGILLFWVLIAYLIAGKIHMTVNQPNQGTNQ
jgi:hypothetical protein